MKIQYQLAVRQLFNNGKINTIYKTDLSVEKYQHHNIVDILGVIQRGLNEKMEKVNQYYPKLLIDLSDETYSIQWLEDDMNDTFRKLLLNFEYEE